MHFLTPHPTPQPTEAELRVGGGLIKGALEDYGSKPEAGGSKWAFGDPLAAGIVT